MKNYLLDSDKDFILNYKVENNQIIVSLSNKKKITIPYTLEDEKELLKKMKRQVLESAEFEQKQQNRFYRSRLLLLVVTFLVVGYSGSFLLDNYSNIFLTIFSIFYTGWFTTLAIYFGHEIIDSKLKIKDMNKNRLFVFNEKNLNENIKVKQNILSKTTNKTKEVVNSIQTKNQPLTLNSIDKIKYKDLKQMLENIELKEQPETSNHKEAKKSKNKVLVRNK